MNFRISILALSLFFISNKLLAQAGMLDPTFGMDGKVITDLGSDDRTADMVIQSNDKIIVAGINALGFQLARYEINGELDLTFGNNGIATIELESASPSTNTFIAIQSDDKILVSGKVSEQSNSEDFALYRLDQDGNLDTTFGINGRVFTDIQGNDDFGKYLLVQEDGKIIQVGYSMSNDQGNFAVVRYHSDGSLDQNFGQEGKIVTPFPNITEGNTIARAVAIQSDQKIVVCGSNRSHQVIDGISFITYHHTIVRYLPNGSLDPTFGDQGLVSFPSPYDSHSGTGIAIQPDQKILIVHNDPFGMIRLNQDGSLDHSFGNNGHVLTSFGIATIGLEIALQANNKILLVGYVVGDPPDTRSDFLLIRYHSDGNLDLSFGDGGKVITDFNEGKNDVARKVLLQKDGKIVVAGYTTFNFNSDFAITRYLNDLQIKTDEVSFLSSGASLFPNPVGTQSLLEYTLAQNATISIDLYDINGRWIQNMVQGKKQSPGLHQETIRFSSELPAGPYILVIANAKERLGISLIKK